MLHVIFTRLCLSHLSVRVGDSSRRTEEAKKSRTAPLNAVIIIIAFPDRVTPVTYTTMATVLGVWRDRVSARTGWPGVSIL